MLFIEIPLWHVKGFVWAFMMLPSAILMLLPKFAVYKTKLAID
jgi:hypothetical protein